jgi:hypothetical protein
VWATTRGSDLRVLGHAEQVLRPGQPRWLVGRVSRPPIRVGQDARLVHRVTKAAVGLGPVSISASGPGILKNHFLFSFGLKLNLNFKNLFLNMQSSKNYEICSVGFIIF